MDKVSQIGLIVIALGCIPLAGMYIFMWAVRRWDARQRRRGIYADIARADARRAALSRPQTKLAAHHLNAPLPHTIPDKKGAPRRSRAEIDAECSLAVWRRQDAEAAAAAQAAPVPTKHRAQTKTGRRIEGYDAP